MNIATNTQAKLLKEKEFNEPCKMVWDNWNNLEEWYGSLLHRNSDKNSSIYYSAPEQWQVIEWLFKTYLIDVSTIPFKEKGVRDIWFQFRVINFNDRNIEEVIFEHQYNTNFERFKTKQEAYSAAFDYVLTNLI